jgi:suppressor of ftsI
MRHCPECLVALLLGIAPLTGQRPDSDHCRSNRAHQPSADLYCLELVGTPGAPASVTGYAILDLAPGPFTLASNRDGVIRYRPRLVLSGLPEPRTMLPDATVFVAWVTTPMFDRWQRLGPVRNGLTITSAIALDQFIIVVSAERDSLTPERQGPLVMRGGSPSTRMQPPDFVEFATGLVGVSVEDLDRIDQGHTNHDPGDGWMGVPMPAGFAMLPAEMLLRPAVAPRRPDSAGVTSRAERTALRRLADGDTLTLVADEVLKRVHGQDQVMYAFNGQIPGPMLWVERGTSVKVRFVNRLDQPSTIHWHGLRHDYRMDGVPELSQPPVPPGGSFEYTLRFPDAGLYWYHPHVREEMQQDLGLSGNIVVRGMAGLPTVAREEILLLDDILIGDDGVIPYGADAVTHALMGRFGNVFLVNGEPRWQSEARPGDTIRLWFTNAANTRTFNLSMTNATMRLVAADLGPFDRVTEVESVVLAPAERYAVDVTLHETGPWLLVNRVRAIDHLMGRFVQQEDTLGVLEDGGRRMEDRGGAAIGPSGIRDTSAAILPAPSSILHPPDFVFEFGLRTRDLPFVTQRMMLLDSAYFHPVEWSGTMPMMNWATTARQAEWFVRDAKTGRENAEARFTVRRGEQRVIRLVNLRNSIHAMQHPIHLHGQRFLVLAVNGVEPTARAWKDTALLPAGATVDILVEFSNPGHWMLHCHIAEHMESGMMTHFEVR